MSHELGVGGAGNGQLTISGGGSLTTDAAHVRAPPIDGIGFGAGTGSVTVTGAGSKWTSNAASSLGVGPPGTLTVSDGGEVHGAAASTSRTARCQSTVRASRRPGPSAAAQVGYLTIDPNGWSGGIGTFNANIVDNGDLAATDAGGFQAQWRADDQRLRHGHRQPHGRRAGDIGAQRLRQPDGQRVRYDFYGWYGTLAIDDAAGFSSTTPIYNFMPSDTIDLKNVPYVSAASSYSFTWGSNRGANDLKVTEGAQTYNLNVGTYYSLSGLLTLKRDASGTGTDIVYTSGGASPFQQWGSPLSNFLQHRVRPGGRIRLGVSNSNDGGQPVWIETETPASSYVAGPSRALQHRSHHPGLDRNRAAVGHGGDDQRSRSVRIGFAGPGQPRRLGVRLEQRRHGHDGPDLLAGVSDPGRLRRRIPAAHHNLCQRPKHRAQHGADRLPHSAGRRGISAAFLGPRDNYTSNAAATEDVLAYATQATATTENMYLQGFSTSAWRRHPIRRRRSRTGHGILSATTGRTEISITATTRRPALPEPDCTLKLSIRPRAHWALEPPFFYAWVHERLEPRRRQRTLRRDPSPVRRRVSKFSAGDPGLPRQLDDDRVKTFDLAGATSDRYAIAAVTDPNDGQTDYTVLAYTDDNQVHLELLNNYGDQIGSDFVVPGVTSFDRLHSIYGTSSTPIASSSITRSLIRTAARRSRALSTTPGQRVITPR